MAQKGTFLFWVDNDQGGICDPVGILSRIRPLPINAARIGDSLKLKHYNASDSYYSKPNSTGIELEVIALASAL
uniref:Uncharacterized protein n=1 Tax=Marinobacter nauticus TaxID=2743 RepID=A0A455W9L6_MARNT|nr:hypothetical protein YBY_12130 [Marinobacter nauticus]